jgi:hypothetical protein
MRPRLLLLVLLLALLSTSCGAWRQVQAQNRASWERRYWHALQYYHHHTPPCCCDDDD